MNDHSVEKRIAELEDSLNVIDKDRECYYAPVIAEKDRRIAELEHELEIARALQPPPPEPEMTLGSAASTEGLASGPRKRRKKGDAQ